MAEYITMAHGNGGRLMHELVGGLRREFSNKILDEMTDAACLDIDKKRIAFSTDSYVIKPVFFPGGDIGKLAVCGTVNDLSMMGARPFVLSLAFIIEEGFRISDLKRITRSIKANADRAGVKVVTGDIKVVEKHAADGIYINTSGIGVIGKDDCKVGRKAKAADAIIINGHIAEHGLAVLNARENFGFESDIRSDCANLNHIVEDCMRSVKKISVMRDLTRGGLATSLNEIALSSNVGIDVFEDRIPIREPVRRLCDALGFDPLYVANEGKFISFVSGKDVNRVKKAMGKYASVIGQVTDKHKKEVHLRTDLGTSRLVPMLEADQLPRIC